MQPRLLIVRAVAGDARSNVNKLEEQRDAQGVCCAVGEGEGGMYFANL